MRWFYHDGTTQVGPIQDTDLPDLIQRGKIKLDTGPPGSGLQNQPK